MTSFGHMPKMCIEQRGGRGKNLFILRLGAEI